MSHNHSQKLINKVIDGVIVREEMDDLDCPRYIAQHMVSVCKDWRNSKPGEELWAVHSWTRGTPYSDDSFFGGYDTQQEAAIAAIKMYGIVAIDQYDYCIIKEK